MFSTFKNYEGNYTFHNASNELGNKSFHPLGYHLYLVRIDADTVGIQLYETVIIEYHRDGSIVLNNGGYDTPTTSKAISKSLVGFGVSSVDSEWVVYNTDDFIYYHFENGIRIDPDGKIEGRPVYLDKVESTTGRSFETAEEFDTFVQEAEVPMLKRLFNRRRIDVREVLALNAPIDFIPLIVAKAEQSDRWGEYARNRLDAGE